MFFLCNAKSSLVSSLFRNTFISPLGIIIAQIQEMSSGNLHKRFASKIVEIGYFAEIPASASDKGRPNFWVFCTKPFPSAVVKHWGIFPEFDSVG